MAQASAEPRIRPADAADLDAVAALDARITAAPKPAYWQEQLRRYAAGPPDRFFLVAEDRKGRLVGFVVGEIRAWEFGAPPCGWVFAIQVDPDTRFAGVGSRLFDALCRLFRESGVNSVRTMVDRKDLAILSFFRAQGLRAGPSLELAAEIPP